MKEFSDSQQVPFTMLDDDNWIPAVDELPPVIEPVGLSPTRQWYLFRQIRDYCREGTQDLTCPKPLIPLPGTGDDPSCLAEPPNQLSEEEERAAEPPPKRIRRCGKCGRAGHTCKEN